MEKVDTWNNKVLRPVSMKRKIDRTTHELHAPHRVKKPLGSSILKGVKSSQNAKPLGS